MISAFLDTLINIILPVFLLIGAGFVLEKACRLDMRTLSKLNFYIFVPALVFVKILESTIALRDVMAIVAFALIHIAVMLAAGAGLSCFPGLRSHGKVMSLGGMFFNAGNYGLPFAELAFPGFGVGVMAVILLVQNLTSFTVGVGVISWGRDSRFRSLLGVLRVPVIYAVAGGLLVRFFDATIPTPVITPLHHLAAGLIPVALLTLGAQLAKPRVGRAHGPLTALCALRLIASPLLAVAIVKLLPLSAETAQVCIAAAALPMAVNVFILAVEYDEDKELASQGVFWTTLLSAVTITIVLLMLKA